MENNFDPPKRTQPLMDKFVTRSPKLERVPATHHHADPFKEDAFKEERKVAPVENTKGREVYEAMTFMQKLTVCRMDEHYTRERVITRENGNMPSFCALSELVRTSHSIEILHLFVRKKVKK